MKRFIVILFGIASMAVCSCEKFLDEKPDKKIVEPRTVRDLQELLDATAILNNGAYGGLQEVATDDYWLSEESFNGLSDFDKDNYKWKPNPLYLLPDVAAHWKSNYEVVLYSNTVLEEVDRMKEVSDQVNHIKGSALFFRSFAFYNVATAFAAPYAESEKESLGIPLRLSTDFNEPTSRATLGETYERIIGDLEKGIALLPVAVEFKTRPSKAAGLALLSRIYLSMENYELALARAQQALAYYDVLIDYNMVDVDTRIPFARFNEETIFYSHTRGAAPLNPSRANISYDLLELYEEDDLRKAAFFNEKAEGIWVFKGGYHGLTNNTFFNGLATDELYLTVAECYARNGDFTESLKWLNQLLKNRIKSSRFVPLVIGNVKDLLNRVLQERRKELLMRGLRWTDLRRLNRQPEFAVILHRYKDRDVLDEESFLPPNDKRYIFLIPQDVVNIAGVQQNER